MLRTVPGTWLMLQKYVFNKEPHEDGTVRTDEETETQLVCDKASFRIQI